MNMTILSSDPERSAKLNELLPRLQKAREARDHGAVGVGLHDLASLFLPNHFQGPGDGAAAKHLSRARAEPSETSANSLMQKYARAYFGK
jgi:hypothetical protein